MMALTSGFSVSTVFIRSAILCCGNDNLHDAGCYHQPELPQQGSRTSGRDEAGIAEALKGMMPLNSGFSVSTVFIRSAILEACRE